MPGPPSTPITQVKAQTDFWNPTGFPRPRLRNTSYAEPVVPLARPRRNFRVSRNIRAVSPRPRCWGSFAEFAPVMKHHRQARPG
jgi:hypothetical protein